MYSFTIKQDVLVSQLLTEVDIIKDIHSDFSDLNKQIEINLGDSNLIKAKALWDTGATRTCITKKVVEKFNLPVIEYIKMQHAAGISQTGTYLLHLGLPNKVLLPNLVVTEFHSNEFDVLIGMDIITQGDFHISNNQEKTLFTFRIPSTSNLDYVVETKNIEKATFTYGRGRNDKCGCGSDKKVKHCHGIS
jgi:predicted aspartyl protease